MRKVALLAVAVLFAALPAAAEDPYEPNLVNERVYFECGDYAVQDVGDAEGSYATWTTTAPEQSVADGAGCGSLDSVFTNTSFGNPYDASWRGFFSGNLDTLTLEVHNIYAGPARATGDFDVAVRVNIDGRALFPFLGEQVTVTPVRSPTGVSELLRISITDIGLLSEDEDFEHWVEVVLHGGTTRHTGPTITDTVSGWVWGTTEVPSGIEFNPDAENLAEAQLSAGGS